MGPRGNDQPPRPCTSTRPKSKLRHARDTDARGEPGMGIVMTALLGIAGSFVGGFVGSMFTGASILDFNTAGLIGSVLGALAVLLVMGFAGRRTAHA